MKLDWLNDFSDPYLKTTSGQGVFLSGIILGMLARYQVSKEEDIDSAPMFKQLMFGKMQRRDLLRHLSLGPEFIRAYDLPNAWLLVKLTLKAVFLLLKGTAEMGVDGNFTFSVAFLNASEYFWRIFGKTEVEE